jgi:hypothetical protein
MSTRTDELRREIEQERERLGETAEALGYKTDVPSRAKEAVSGRVGAIKGKVTGAGHSVADRTPSTGDARAGARKAVGIAQENPLGLALASVAAGVLIGSLLPHTRVEDERIGPAADAIKERASDVAQEAVERGREAATEVAGAVKEQATETVREHGQSLAESAKESAQQGASEARQAAGEANKP